MKKDNAFKSTAIGLTLILTLMFIYKLALNEIQYHSDPKS